MQKTFAQLSDRQSSLKERLNVLSKRLFRYKTKELVRHIVNQLDKFDEHAIKNQVKFFRVNIQIIIKAFYLLR